jgi:hypothetical protein
MMARISNARLMVLVYGFLLWPTTFLVSVVINPLKDTSVPLFDSLMPVALSAPTLWFLYLYFKGVPTGYAKAGLIARGSSG